MNASLCEEEAQMKDWAKFASERLGKRTLRHNRNTAPTKESETQQIAATQNSDFTESEG